MNTAKPLTIDEQLKIAAEVQAMEREVDDYLKATKSQALKQQPSTTQIND